MTQEIIFSEYKPGDERAIIDLFNICYKRELPESTWRWRFAENILHSTMVGLAWDGNILAAHYAVTPVELFIRGSKFITGLSGTTMTRPEYRGRGLFPKLAERVYSRMSASGMVMVWGFQNANSHRGFIRDLHWRDVYEIPTLRRATMPEDVGAGGHSSIVELVNADDRIDALWQIAMPSFGVAVARTSRYVNWRYFDNPIEKYTVLGCVDGNNLAGFATTKKYGNEIQIVDLLERPGSVAAMTMVKDVIARAATDGCTSVALWCNVNTVLHHELEKAGFVNDNPVIYLGVRLLDRDAHLDVALRYASWHIAMGDSDNF